MDRQTHLEKLYDSLAVFARRSRELSGELHPGLTLVAYTVLSYIDTRPEVRAADIAAEWGLDKSTVSRQLNQLIDTDFLVRIAERRGRRGHALELTDRGRRALLDAAASVRLALTGQLGDWADNDIANFNAMVERFNNSTPRPMPAD